MDTATVSTEAATTHKAPEIACVEAAKANMASAKFHMDAAIAHIEAVTDHIEDTTAHTVPATAHMEPGIDHTETLTSHMIVSSSRRGQVLQLILIIYFFGHHCLFSANGNEFSVMID